MAKRSLNPALYQKVVEGFLEHPDNYNAVARYSGLAVVTVRKAWLHGWTTGGKHSRRAEWAPPIQPRFSQLLQEKAYRQRAEALDAERKAIAFRTEAAGEKEKAHKEEANLVSNARVSVGLLLGLNKHLVPGAMALAEQLKNAIVAQLISPKEAGKLLRDMSTLNRNMIHAGQIAMQLERLLRGDPMKIVEERKVEMTVEEATHEIESAQIALERFRRRGLEVLEGGAGQDEQQPEEVSENDGTENTG
jgi:hypothetical protein